MSTLGSLLTAMVTPMTEDGQVDVRQTEKLAQRLIQQGSDGVVVCGTTGESPVLTDEEKVTLYKAVVEAIGGQGVVVAGTGSYDTRHSIELTREAEKAGADAIMLVTPYYNRPPQEGLYRHFRAIAESTSLPIILYNVPSRTACNILPDTVARLAEIDNIVAIKESAGNMDQVSELRIKLPPDFLIYSGDDSLTLPMMALGATGVISVASHVAGPRIREMIAAFQRGDERTALRIHLELFPLFRALFVTTNPIPVKRALNLTGFNAGPTRLPLPELDEESEEILKQALKSLDRTS